MPDGYESLVSRDEGDVDETTQADVYLPMTDSDKPLVAFKSFVEYREAVARDDPDSKTMRYKSADTVPDGIPIIRGVGSTSLIDVDGDVFHPEAIEMMIAKSVDINVLLGHQKVPPQNQFGGVFEAGHKFVKNPEDGKEYAGIDLGVDLQVDNEFAVKTHDYMVGKNARPRKYGFSVGAVYTDCRRRFNKSMNTYHGLDVRGAIPVEYSVTPLPANRLSYIEFVTKSLKRRGVLPKDAAGGWLSDEVSYRMIRRDEFDDVDWRNMCLVAKHFEDNFGIVFCKPRSF